MHRSKKPRYSIIWSGCGCTPRLLDARNAGKIDATFATLAQRRAEALLTTAGLDADHSRFLPLDLVEQRGRENDAALERHALPVIAGRAAADRQRNAVPRAGGGHANHVALVAGRNHDIGNLVLCVE